MVNSGIGAANGPRRNAPFNRWFRYPAGFSELALLRAVELLDLRPGAIVADAFAGSAVGGTHLNELGMEFIGIEAHPMVAELAQLKLRVAGNPEQLVAAARTAADASKRQSTVTEHILVRACFEPSTLGVLTSLRDEIKRSRSPWRTHLKWALLATLRDCSNAGVGWPYQRPQLQRLPTAPHARERFLQRAELMAADIAGRQFIPHGRVVAGDSRTAKAWQDALGRQLADACLTSPPYLNNYDYADATRLETYFWGFADSWRTLVERVRSPMMVATTQQTSLRLALAAGKQLSSVKPLGDSIRTLAQRLAAERAKRPRGKQYDALLLCYLADMSRVLARLKYRLVPGAKAVFIVGDSAPYGVYVDTPLLIGRLAQANGFELIGVDHLRERGLRWRQNGTRHAVALSERMVVLRVPNSG